MQQTVTWSSRNSLSCAASVPVNVILCVKPDLVQPPTCAAGAESPDPTAVYKTLEGTITAVIPHLGCNSSYRYTIVYDDVQLLPGLRLISTDIRGIACQDCLVEWVKEQVGNEVTIETAGSTQTLVTQHGCRYELAAGGGGGGGGDCVNAVTTAEFNALIASTSLVLGCTYIITDHIQGHVPANTQITLIATSTSTVESACSVQTSFDPRGWRGVYDVPTNLLTELSDNQGNVCRQYFDGIQTQSVIEDFDWGNPSFTNCVIDGSALQVTYGVVGTFNSIRLYNNAILNMVGYAALPDDRRLNNIEVRNDSSLNIANSVITIDGLLVSQGSHVNIATVAATRLGPQSLLRWTVVDTESFIDVPATSALLIEGAVIRNGSSISLQDGSSLNLNFSDISNNSRVVTETAFTMTGTDDFGVRHSTITDSSILKVTDGASKNIVVAQAHLSGQAEMEISGTTVANLSTDNVTLSSNGFLTIQSGTTQCDSITVSVGLLETGGFNLFGVYLNGNLSSTCTAANTDKGRDYFNNSIV